MRSGSGCVDRGARVVARMSCGYRVYRQGADPFTTSGHDDVRNVVTVVTGHASDIDRPTVQ